MARARKLSLVLRSLVAGTDPASLTADAPEDEETYAPAPFAVDARSASLAELLGRLAESPSVAVRGWLLSEYLLRVRALPPAARASALRQVRVLYARPPWPRLTPEELAAAAADEPTDPRDPAD